MFVCLLLRLTERMFFSIERTFLGRIEVAIVLCSIISRDLRLIARSHSSHSHLHLLLLYHLYH